jgi:antitoxin VapB
MAFNIKDEQTDALARKVAAMTGEGITQAVRSSLDYRLKELERERDYTNVITEIDEICSDISAHMPAGAHSLDHGELLYGEDGLPK